MTIGYGNVVPTTPFGRIDAVRPGLVGVVFTGLIIAAAVRGGQEASHRAREQA
jgi:voltage-gated potassium channel